MSLNGCEFRGIGICSLGIRSLSPDHSLSPMEVLTSFLLSFALKSLGKVPFTEHPLVQLSY